MSYWSDLWAVIKGDGIALDETEAALLGAPDGETISMWDAIQTRHGVFLAHVGCAMLAILVEVDYCANTLAGRPLTTLAYFRAIVGLLALAWVPICLWKIFVRHFA